MAHIEVNAMSVKLTSTFEAEVYFPGLELEKGKKYPVIWFVHPDGTGPVELQKYSAVLDEFAEKKRVFIIAPDISHSLCTDMTWGTYNEQFIAKECPGIFRVMYPISDKKEDNYILGIGSGAYGAIKVAAHYKDDFQAAIAINGELDLAKKCAHEEGYNGFAFQTDASLEALFGDAKKVRDSKEDLFSDKCDLPGKAYLFCSEKYELLEDSIAYCEHAKKAAEFIVTKEKTDSIGTNMLVQNALNNIF